MSDSDLQGLRDTLDGYSRQVSAISDEDFSAVAAVDGILKLVQDFVSDHSGHTAGSIPRRNSEPKRDTPGVETFFWSLWEFLFRDIGMWEAGEVRNMRKDRAVAFIKEIHSRPKGEVVWTVWGDDVDFASLPLLGPSIREANNGPFYYTGPSDAEMVRPEVQNALATATEIESTDEVVLLAAKRRKEWLGLQGLIARLLGEVGLDEFTVYGIWAARDGLEDWPEDPPAIITEPPTGELPFGEDTAAYRALMVEGAAMWLRHAAPELYACTEIWGPNGNPNWKPNQGAPGRGGERWDGVDGMDQEKKRWGLWKDVLGKVIAWYDKEASEGRGKGWRVREVSVQALEAMKAAERR